MNFCLESGYFAEGWKTSIVIPLPKNVYLKSSNDLRPISLIRIISNVLEKVINKQIYGYVNSVEILPALQSGFRKGSVLSRLFLFFLMRLSNPDIEIIILL